MRKKAFEAMYTTYGAIKNTLASTLASTVKYHNYNAEVRHYPSAVEAALHDDNVPVTVYENLIESAHEAFPAYFDYASLLLDFGRGRRLERFGPYVVERPDPRAAGECALGGWKPDWIYVAPLNRGIWEPQRKGLPREWSITMEGLRLTVRLGEGGEVGLRQEKIIG